MIGVFKRFFKVAQSEAHSMVDKLENPVKLTEQGIRDLRKDLTISLKNLAEVKSLTIRLKREQTEKKQIATEYEKKAMLLLTRGQKGDINGSDADRLAGEALAKKESAATRAVQISQDLVKQESMVAKMESGVKTVKSQISKWETELTTLRARAKIASSTKRLNQQLAQVDSAGTISLLEKMKSKVEEDEALAESYGEIASVETSVDDEINKALEGSGPIAGQDSLAALKAKMGMVKG